MLFLMGNRSGVSVSRVELCIFGQADESLQGIHQSGIVTSGQVGPTDTLLEYRVSGKHDLVLFKVKADTILLVSGCVEHSEGHSGKRHGLIFGRAVVFKPINRQCAKLLFNGLSSADMIRMFVRDKHRDGSKVVLDDIVNDALFLSFAVHPRVDNQALLCRIIFCVRHDISAFTIRITIKGFNVHNSPFNAQNYNFFLEYAKKTQVFVKKITIFLHICEKYTNFARKTIKTQRYERHSH